jgi:hypothetical protein
MVGQRSSSIGTVEGQRSSGVGHGVSVVGDSRGGGIGSVSVVGSSNMGDGDRLLVEVGLGRDLDIDVGLGRNLDINIGLGSNLLMNVGLSSNLNVDVGLSSDLLVNVGLGSDLNVNVGLGGDLDINVGLSERVEVGIGLRGIVMPSVDTTVGRSRGGESVSVSVSSQGKTVPSVALNGVSTMVETSVSSKTVVGTSVPSRHNDSSVSHGHTGEGGNLMMENDLVTVL